MRQNITFHVHIHEFKHTNDMKTTCTESLGWDSRRAHWGVHCYFLQNDAHLGEIPRFNEPLNSVARPRLTGTGMGMVLYTYFIMINYSRQTLNCLFNSILYYQGGASEANGWQQHFWGLLKRQTYVYWHVESEAVVSPRNSRAGAGRPTEVTGYRMQGTGDRWLEAKGTKHQWQSTDCGAELLYCMYSRPDEGRWNGGSRDREEECDNQPTVCTKEKGMKYYEIANEVY